MLHLLYITYPSLETAQEAAKLLLEEKLIACANILPEMLSLYVWEGKQCETQEVLMLCKTAEATLEAAMERAFELHPFDCPCIVAYKPEQALDVYAAWVESQCLP